jgi:glycosyltransferase involved in cell wall biosynthesis
VRVTVIIPTHNRAGLLPNAIASVLNQTFKDFELLIIDDVSIDNTEEVVRTFSDNRIRYIKIAPEDQGGGESCAKFWHKRGKRRVHSVFG